MPSYFRFLRLAALLAAAPIAARAQGVGIGTPTPDASAALDVSSTGKGFLPPRLTYAQRTGIANAAAGLLVYQSDDNASPAAASGYYYYSGTQWLPLLSLGDNLGNHTATTKLNLGANALTGAGASISGVGVGIRADGGLNLGQSTVGNNVLLGYQAGQAITYGDFSLFIGYQSGYSTTYGEGNQFSGYKAGYSNTAGNSNLFSGYLSGYNNTGGSNNLFSGIESGYSNTTGSYNQFLGTRSGYSNTTGSYNLFSGADSGGSNTTGSNNLFSGNQAGMYNTTGSDNTFSGNSSGGNNSTGSDNTFSGSDSGRENSTGSSNTFFGVMSGYYNQTGSNNWGFGYFAGPAVGHPDLTNAGAIGYNAHVSQSNSLALGGTGVDAINVGIGTGSPSFALHVMARNPAQITQQDYSYFRPQDTRLNQMYNGAQNPQTGNVAGYFEGELWATSVVGCGQLAVLSDARLKTVLGRSDNAADLALLARLRITDYAMRDRGVYGAQCFKKVIAQEVEAVFPQAVSRRPGFVPDVYQLVARPEVLAGDSLLRLALVVPAGGAAADQRLKLLLPTGAEVLAQVARAAPAGAPALLVRWVGALHGAAGPLFAYGLEHTDVRAVDYDALAMLNVSATQELARQVAELQKQNAALRGTVQTRASQAAADHADLQTLKEQLARLLGDIPPATAQARK